MRGMFTGSEKFQKTMPNKLIKQIHGNILFLPNEDIDLTIWHTDPLWHSWHLLDVFQHQCLQVTVPVGTCTFDKNCKPTKAQSKAITFLPTKPYQYGVRFYP